MAAHCLKVGIDFGTTFSGVAYIDTAKPDDVISIMNWPGEPRNFEKVPSEISYNAAGEVHKWGYEINEKDEKLAWFKLLLDPTQYASKNSSTLSRTLGLFPEGPQSKEPVHVVSDYLSCLRKHTLATLERSYGKVFMNAIPIKYTLTVPAMWTDTAKALTLDAAVGAGLGSRDEIELMSEPDAAAAWTLLKDLQSTHLKRGDVFVVVDCGGGTVDLISYEILSLSPNISVKECAGGKGELCGSTFLNQRFEDLVISRAGKQNFDKMKTRSLNRMLREFDQSLKRNFTNAEDDDEFVCAAGGLPDKPEAGIECGEFTFTREDMLGIFDPIIDRIVPLVQNQIDVVDAQHAGVSPVSAVLLVGGFGSSQYLYQRLQNELKKGEGIHRSSPEILQPVHAWSAVARGAAHGIHISSRKARRHYGTKILAAFIHGKHPIENMEICRYSGRQRCENVMDWFINYGDQVSENAPISITYYRNVGLSDSLIFYDDLYEYAGTSAPEYSNRPHNGTLRTLCKVTSDLSNVSKSRFRLSRGINGQPFYEVFFNLVITIKSAAIVFHLELDGVKYGTAKATYIHDFNAMRA
ncbi:actin-like ATPase domain-containing protein [Morchella conica CCBAS932]|uniref:Actin-like ATPase domain-containing protein n=1 Tax=Morchella conica CCBAS932 TaxID=1392247 RepID=A0A3N4L6Q8_9PEZI|nr:actin-like ATPase domain-containing protein [Morchella conica CCBAS932]